MHFLAKAAIVTTAAVVLYRQHALHNIARLQIAVNERATKRLDYHDSLITGNQNRAEKADREIHELIVELKKDFTIHQNVSESNIVDLQAKSTADGKEIQALQTQVLDLTKLVQKSIDLQTKAADVPVPTHSHPAISRSIVAIAKSLDHEETKP